jgi:hypothetical protein
MESVRTIQTFSTNSATIERIFDREHYIQLAEIRIHHTAKTTGEEKATVVESRKEISFLLISGERNPEIAGLPLGTSKTPLTASWLSLDLVKSFDAKDNAILSRRIDRNQTTARLIIFPNWNLEGV